ncbi:hypothetical protein HYPSUDRAFT_205113 [Hypholoma sublateritium FD-334 SS-4]|uniref:Uncharacterized protein n=1 Tax=Hypholoma sublateritium (strain FD-334 SS-4) TaxID=945553 RepID=A0A0D2NIM7_HYPSF|nr:hypothetical protein HYPSUDRAFT_205113 [Hypholoma sublateritium FD-334 SS-4]
MRSAQRTRRTGVYPICRAVYKAPRPAPHVPLLPLECPDTRAGARPVPDRPPHAAVRLPNPARARLFSSFHPLPPPACRARSSSSASDRVPLHARTYHRRAPAHPAPSPPVTFRTSQCFHPQRPARTTTARPHPPTPSRRQAKQARTGAQAAGTSAPDARPTIQHHDRTPTPHLSAIITHCQCAPAIALRPSATAPDTRNGRRTTARPWLVTQVSMSARPRVCASPCMARTPASAARLPAPFPPTLFTPPPHPLVAISVPPILRALRVLDAAGPGPQPITYIARTSTVAHKP